MARKARKIKDKWKEKKWVNVVAPDSFNNVNIGYVPITDDENSFNTIDQESVLFSDRYLAVKQKTANVLNLFGIEGNRVEITPWIMVFDYTLSIYPFQYKWLAF